jgi:uncharacterized membrane protein
MSSSTSDTGLASNVASGLCAIFTWIGGLIFYFIEKKDSLVRHWAVQAIFFGGTWVVVSIAFNIVTVILSHVPLIGALIGLLALIVFWVFVVLWIMGIINAFQGKRWEYPIISAQCKKLFPKLAP